VLAARRPFRGYAWYCRDDLAASIADTRAAVDLTLAHDMPIYGAFASGWPAFPLVDTGDRDAAGHVLAAYAATFGPDAPLGVNYLLTARAHLRLAQGRPAEAAADARECGRRELLFSRSPTLCRWRPQLALALFALGGALRRAGRRRDARERLRTGLDTALRCGATAVARQAHDELLAAGAQPRQLRTSGLDALTPTERRVAQTVAGGLANRDAAQALFVSEKTIETHSRHAYAKLGI
jgi:DNA-binding CsgD family transcriptional regulator